MKQVLCVVWCVALCSGVAHGAVKVWELPQGGEIAPAKREGWKPAAKGAAPAGGVAIENDRLVVVVQPGSAGPVLVGKGVEPGTQVPLALLGADGKAGKVGKVEVVKADGGAAAVRFTAGACEAELRLGAGHMFATVLPRKGAARLEIRAGGRYTLIPDFFANDVVYDAQRLKSDRVMALADNFYLIPMSGGNALVMPVWQAFDVEKGQEAREESAVDLLLAGEGDARRFSGGRVVFPNGKKPVFVALLEAEGIWHAEDVSDWPVVRKRKIAWQRPFEAKWRTNFIAKEGQRSRDFKVSVLSFYFPELPRPKGAKGVREVRHPRYYKLAYYDTKAKIHISWWQSPKSLSKNG